MNRAFLVVMLAAGLCVGCERRTPHAGDAGPPPRPYVSGQVPLGHWGVGPIRATTYFETPVIAALFPKAKVSDGVYTIATTQQLPIITVDQGGVRMLEIDDSVMHAPHSDDPLVGQVRLLGGPVRGPRGETLGMLWRDAGFDLSQCELGEDRGVNALVCARPGEGAITYVFAVHGWGSEVDFPSEAFLRANGWLREIVWTPPPQLRPHPVRKAPPTPAPAG
jgi:hypothetical protein